MAKKLGFEVVATKPVCVDFRDGRTISYRPGARFTASVTNASVQRLLRSREVRKLNMNEAVGAEPIKLGAPRRVQKLLQRRAEVDAARRVALAKQAASKKAQPAPEPVDLSSLTKPTKKTAKKKPKPSAPVEESRRAEDI